MKRKRPANGGSAIRQTPRHPLGRVGFTAFGRRALHELHEVGIRPEAGNRLEGPARRRHFELGNVNRRVEDADALVADDLARRQDASADRDRPFRNPLAARDVLAKNHDVRPAIRHGRREKRLLEIAEALERAHILIIKPPASVCATPMFIVPPFPTVLRYRCIRYAAFFVFPFSET